MSACNYAILWREAPMPPLEGEVPNEREAEGVCYEIQDTLQNTNDTLSAAADGGRAKGASRQDGTRNLWMFRLKISIKSHGF